MNNTQHKIPGIIGGMGPEATVDFMTKIMCKTKASCDQDHIHMLINHNPRIPNRHDAISGDPTVVGNILADIGLNLEQAGADFLLIVCNTAYAFQKHIEAACNIPLVSIIDEVLGELNNQWPDIERVGIMAAEGCLEAGLYQEALVSSGKTPILWSKEEVTLFMSLVYRIKAGDPLDEISPHMAQLAQSLYAKGAEAIIMGCTEIPLVLKGDILPIPLLCSTDILAARTLDYALGKKIPDIFNI